MKLVLPSINYKDSFIQAVKEYKKEDSKNKHLRDTHYKSLDLEELTNNFNNYIDKILSISQGENLPQDYVAETTYWLVDKDIFIGRISIRHKLTDKLFKEGGHIGYDVRPSQRKKGFGKKILKLGLKKAKKLGITKVLITCNVNNLASKKVIELNGGIFENAIKVKSQPDKLRYWINLK